MALSGIVSSMHAPMLLAMDAVPLGPVILGFLRDPGIAQVSSLLRVSPFCLVFARGLNIEFDITLNVLKDQEKGSCADRNGVLGKVILPMPFGRAHSQQVCC